jgi:zinc protease
MKRIIFVILFLLIVFSYAAAQNDPRKLTFPDIEFKPIKPNVENIQKGITFYYIEDHEIPAINIYFIFKVGKLNDYPGKEGLANLTFNLMLTGGTRSLTPDQIEEKLDFLGSKVSVTVNNEYAYITLWTLSKNFEESWSLLLDMIQNPRFDLNRLEVEKNKELENIRRRWDEPRQIGFIMLNELVYGKNYPDIRRTTSESINSVTIEDIQSFYNKYIFNKELIIGAAGDFRHLKVKTAIKKGFKDWNGNLLPQLNLPKASLFSEPGIYFINKEDMTQAVICAGHLGLNRLDQDNVEISILNFIYGTGGFNSQLLREIRSNRGLAYSAFGYVGLGRDRGIFISYTQTKNESAGEAIKLILQIMENLIKNRVSVQELNTAIKSEQNSFIHRFNSTQSILLQSILLTLEGYPKDYLDTYISRIKKVDVNKVQELAKKTMDPKNIIILVIGKKEEIFKQLESLNIGNVKEIELPKE